MVLFTKMRLVSWYGGTIYQSILNNGFCNLFKQGSTFTPIPASCLKNYSLLLKEDFQNSQLGQFNVRNKSEFANKNEFKSRVSKINKYIKGGDGKSDDKEAGSKELFKNKLAGKNLSEKHKKNKDEVKRFKVKDGICDHDLQIKINSMLKYVQKGKKVLCDVVATREKSKLNEVLKKLNDSELKNHMVETKSMPTYTSVTYLQKLQVNSEEIKQEKPNKSS